MKRNYWISKLAGLLLIICLIFCTACGGDHPHEACENGHSDKDHTVQIPSDPEEAEEAAANDLIRTLSADENAGPGQEWSMMAIAASSLAEQPEVQYILTQYQENLRVAVKRTEGILDAEKPTDNARAAIVLQMMGTDPLDMEGFDLTGQLDDYDAVRQQGINAEIWALTAAAVCGQELEHVNQYTEDICGMQGENGGITYDGMTEDVDITAMALQALALTEGTAAGDEQNVTDVMTGARTWLADRQAADGGYGNAESTAQVILALSCMGENPADAADFTKEGGGLYEGLMQYRVKDGFCHVPELPEDDIMATEQALCALDAIVLAKEGKCFFR